MRDSALTTIVKSYKNNVNIQFFTQASFILDGGNLMTHRYLDNVNVIFLPSKMQLLSAAIL